jgi:outer membrane protein assembly factor BamB
MYCLMPDGVIQWKFATGDWIRCAPTVMPDSLVCFGGFDGYVYAVNLDGTLRWRLATPSWIAASPAVAADGTLYWELSVPDSGYNLTAVGPCDGDSLPGVPPGRLPSLAMELFTLAQATARC